MKKTYEKPLSKITSLCLATILAASISSGCDDVCGPGCQCHGYPGGGGCNGGTCTGCNQTDIDHPNEAHSTYNLWE